MAALENVDWLVWVVERPSCGINMKLHSEDRCEQFVDTATKTCGRATRWNKGKLLSQKPPEAERDLGDQDPTAGCASGDQSPGDFSQCSCLEGSGPIPWGTFTAPARYSNSNRALSVRKPTGPR